MSWTELDKAMDRIGDLTFQVDWCERLVEAQERQITALHRQAGQLAQERDCQATNATYWFEQYLKVQGAHVEWPSEPTQASE